MERDEDVQGLVRLFQKPRVHEPERQAAQVRAAAQRHKERELVMGEVMAHKNDARARSSLSRPPPPKVYGNGVGGPFPPDAQNRISKRAYLANADRDAFCHKAMAAGNPKAAQYLTARPGEPVAGLQHPFDEDPVLMAAYSQ